MEGTILEENDLQRLQCVSLGGNPYPTLKWFRGNDKGQEISGLTSVTGSGVSSELIIRVKPVDNSIVYRCEASNIATIEALMANIKLSVHFISPIINIKSIPKEPKDGDKAIILAETGSCSPKCTLVCMHNNVDLIRLDDEQYVDSEHGGQSTIARYSKHFTWRDDQSQIHCYSNNKHINKTSKQKYLLRVLRKCIQSNISTIHFSCLSSLFPSFLLQLI